MYLTVADQTPAGRKKREGTMTTLQQVAVLIFPEIDECPHARIDCYDENDPYSEEYVGWHCIDCGVPVPAPTVDIPVIDDLPV